MIENSNFSIGFRGYTPKEVDEFLDVLLVSVVDLESKNEALKAELAEKDTLLKTQQEDAAIDTNEDDLNAECEKLKTELKKYETLKSEFMSMIVQIRQETADEMKDTVADVAKYKEIVADKEETIAALQTELSTLKESVAAFSDSFNKVIAEGQSLVDSKDAYIDFLQDQMEKAEADKASASNNFDECQSLSEKLAELISPSVDSEETDIDSEKDCTNEDDSPVNDSY